MKEQLISFETAKLAKEKGFNESCVFAYFNLEDGHKFNGKLDNFDHGQNRQIYPKGKNSEYDHTYVTAPTQSLLQKWLREKHNISIKIDDFVTNERIRYDYNVCVLGSQEDNPKGVYRTYEEALEEGLLEALKLIKT